MITIILAILVICFYIALAEIAAYAASIIFLAISAIYLLVSIIKYSNSKKLSASQMKCPNCGSMNVKIKKAMTGSQTSSVGSAYGGAHAGLLGVTGGGIGSSNSNTNFKFKREAICEDCGFNYDYVTNEDIVNVQNKYVGKITIASVLLIISIFCFTKTSNLFKPETSSKSQSTTANVSSTGIWADKITSIDEFDHYLDGNQVYLKKYEGDDSKVWIDSEYEIDGDKYYVTEFADAVFVFSDVKSVILPEGLVSMPNNTFNSSDVENLYIPSTLVFDTSGYSWLDYLHDADTIYYGGTEDQWKAMVGDKDRSDIDARKIEYDVNISDLTK